MVLALAATAGACASDEKAPTELAEPPDGLNEAPDGTGPATTATSGAPSTATESSPPTTTEPPDTSDVPVGRYEVILRGQASEDPFERPATVTVTPTVTTTGSTNGVNAIEVCLRSGSPTATPDAGAVWLGSNSACFPTSQADVDLAVVTPSGAAVTVAPDSDLAATRINVFSAADSPGACVYAVSAGEVVYRFGPDSVAATLEITGTGDACGPTGGSATYTATLTGTRM